MSIVPIAPLPFRQTFSLTAMPSTDSWQNALRRQYQRREPEASPIGLMARSHHYIVESSRASTAPPWAPTEVLRDEAEREKESSQREQSTTPSPDNLGRVDGPVDDLEHISIAKIEEEEVSSEALEEPEKQPDWLELSMLTKLESLHMLAEWQFQNPLRVRHQMKTDDEQAAWVC